MPTRSLLTSATLAAGLLASASPVVASSPPEGDSPAAAWTAVAAVIAPAPTEAAPLPPGQLALLDGSGTETQRFEIGSLYGDETITSGFGSNLIVASASGGSLSVVDTSTGAVTPASFPTGSAIRRITGTPIVVAADLGADPAAAGAVIVNGASGDVLDVADLELDFGGVPTFDLAAAQASADGALVTLTDFNSMQTAIIDTTAPSAVVVPGWATAVTESFVSLNNVEGRTLDYRSHDGEAISSVALPDALDGTDLGNGVAMLIGLDGELLRIDADHDEPVALGTLEVDPDVTAGTFGVLDGNAMVIATFEDGLVVIDPVDGAVLGELADVDASAPQFAPERDDRCLAFGFESVALVDFSTLEVTTTPGASAGAGRSADGCTTWVLSSGTETGDVVLTASGAYPLAVGETVRAVADDGTAAIVAGGAGLEVLDVASGSRTPLALDVPPVAVELVTLPA